jgi:hypothetical protein
MKESYVRSDKRVSPESPKERYNREVMAERGWQSAMEIFEERAGVSFGKASLDERAEHLGEIVDDVERGIITDAALAKAISALMYVTREECKAARARDEVGLVYPSILRH